MKIGILSDTHLTRVTPAFKHLLKTHFKDVDLILHAGDIVGLPVYEFLQSLGVEAVLGNMDEGNLRTLLPAKRNLTFGDHKIGLIHGWGSAHGLEERLLSEFNDINCLVYGHSHKPANHRSEGVLLFNPGSASGIGFFGKPTLGFLHIDDAGIKGEILEI
jgi:uncharacterized protein